MNGLEPMLLAARPEFDLPAVDGARIVTRRTCMKLSANIHR